MGGNNSGSKIDLVRVNPELNMRRFYTASVGYNLFGDAVLTKNWGRISTGGRIKCEFFEDIDQAIRRLELVEFIKARKGYKHRQQ